MINILKVIKVMHFALVYVLEDLIAAHTFVIYPLQQLK